MAMTIKRGKNNGKENKEKKFKKRSFYIQEDSNSSKDENEQSFDVERTKGKTKDFMLMALEILQSVKWQGYV